MAMQTLDLGGRRGTPYVLLAGIVIGSLLTALVVPFVAGESLTGDGATEVGVGREGPGLDVGSDREAGDERAESSGEAASDEPRRAGGVAGAAGAATDDPAAAVGPGAEEDPQATGGHEPGAGLRATDVGVTAKTVKIGFLLLDTASLSRIGIAVPGVDPETQRQAWEAQLADINSRYLVVYQSAGTKRGSPARCTSVASSSEPILSASTSALKNSPAVRSTNQVSTSLAGFPTPVARSPSATLSAVPTSSFGSLSTMIVASAGAILALPLSVAAAKLVASVGSDAKARAALEGMSLSDYLLNEIRRTAERPTLEELRKRAAQLWERADVLVVPTAPTIRTLTEMAQEPVLFNSQFGTYTNFTNLADLSALALPGPLREDGLPAGITLIAPAWHDRALAAFGLRWQRQSALPLGAIGRALPPQPAPASSSGHVRLAVVGAHLSGMPLNVQLTQRDAVQVEQTATAPCYRLYALADTEPPKPGLARAAQGAAIRVELWAIPLARSGEFVAEIPAPLGIGTLLLADGRAQPAARAVARRGVGGLRLRHGLAKASRA